MSHRTRAFLFPAAAMLAFWSQHAIAMINPQFTPVHLVAQSDGILQLRAKPGSAAGQIVFSVERVWKGREDAREIAVNLTTLAPDRANAISGVMKDPAGALALMFVASWPDKPGDAPTADETETRAAYIQMNGMWLVLKQDKAKTWRVEKESTELLGTWNGGSDMLLRAIQYILEDPDADVPSETSVKWGTVHNLGEIGGKITGMTAVDMQGSGVPLLFVASDAGDRIYSLVGDKPTNLTAKVKLTSRSRRFAWGDFNGDGLLDLASWDGKALTLYLQAKDGTFAPSAGAAKELPECLALTTLDIGVPGKAGLLVSTGAAPLLLSPAADATPRAVMAGEWPGKDSGKVYPCLVADFDNDGLPDMIQPMARGGLFYKGTAPGVFAAPVPCPVAGGDGAGMACIGDWNGDGKLDILIPGNDQFRLWENHGGGNFAEVAQLTGELSYNAKSRQVAACLCDVNNDGRQDVLLLYASGAPKAFFNRGFRSFGVSYSLDMGAGDLLPGIDDGQIAGCMADFNGDGAEDLAVALANGTCAVIMRESAGADQCARIALSVKSGKPGPVRLCGASGKRLLGAWNLIAGAAPAFVARSEAGPLKITWQFPGKAEESKDVVLENKPLTVLIGEPGK